MNPPRVYLQRCDTGEYYVSANLWRRDEQRAFDFGRAARAEEVAMALRGEISELAIIIRHPPEANRPDLRIPVRQESNR